MRKIKKLDILAVALILTGLLCNSWTMVRWYTPLTYTTIEYKAIVMLLDIAFLWTGTFLLVWRNKPSQTKNILAVWCSAIISIFILELGCRFYLFGWKCLSFKRINSVYSAQSPCQPDIYQRSPFRDIIVELKPNKDTYFHLARFQTNTQGLRDREYAVTKPDHTFRVAVVGDSVTMGWGVELEETYVKRLEKRANADFTDKHYEFINFAVSGYGLRDYLAVIKRKVLPYNPDLILIGGFCNDDEIIPEEAYEHPRPLAPKADPVLRLFFLDMIKTSNVYQAVVHRHDRVNPSELKDRHDFADRMFGELKKVQQQSQIPFVVAYLYTPRYRNENIREMSEKYQFPFVDTSSAFDRDKFKDYVIYPIDGHPNALSHAYYARVIYDYLVKENRLNNAH